MKKTAVQKEVLNFLWDKFKIYSHSETDIIAADLVELFDNLGVLITESEPYEAEEYDHKDIFLKNGDSIVGLHAIGFSGPYTYTLEHIDGTQETTEGNFQSIESWGNEYDSNFEFIRSFRIGHSDTEIEAAAFIENGWERIEGPK